MNLGRFLPFTSLGKKPNAASIPVTLSSEQEELLSSAGNAQELFSGYLASLPNNSEIETGWFDLEEYGAYQIGLYSPVPGLIQIIETSNFQSGGGRGDDITTNTVLTSLPSIPTLPKRQRWINVKWRNETGNTVANVALTLNAFYNTLGAAVFAPSIAPSNFTPALQTSSTIFGYDTNGEYKRLAMNSAGAALMSSFGTEVARGKYEDEGWRIDTLEGKNSDVDTASTPEDMWNGGGEYTGFNAIANENIETFSASANDTGSVLSSGVSTDGTALTISLTGATFITDGITVGDLLINDTKIAHGHITALTQEEITVFRMTNGVASQVVNEAGDSFRVATATGSGAAVMRHYGILNEDFEKQPAVYVVLNGVTGVVTPADAMRLNHSKVVLSGSTDHNEGTITIRQAITTANVFAQVPITGETTTLAGTVPKNEVFLIKHYDANIVRSTGAAGSATILLRVREPKGGSWTSPRILDVQTGGKVNVDKVGGILLYEGEDFKYTIDSVSDNNTIATGFLEYYEINE